MSLMFIHHAKVTGYLEKLTTEELKTLEATAKADGKAPIVVEGETFEIAGDQLVC